MCDTTIIEFAHVGIARKASVHGSTRNGIRERRTMRSKGAMLRILPDGYVVGSPTSVVRFVVAVEGSCSNVLFGSCKIGVRSLHQGRGVGEIGGKGGGTRSWLRRELGIGVGGVRMVGVRHGGKL
jgi:hypothetical protein